MRVPIRKPGKYTHFKPDARLTAAKLEELTVKLKRLKEHAQPEAMREVMQLAHDGDFSENAGYQAAKGRLRGINRRIEYLEDLTARAEIIKLKKNGIVQLGNRVTIDTAGKIVSYLILGPSETDPSRGIISDQSLIGSMLMGKKLGDTVELVLEGKSRDCLILSID